MYIYTHAYTYTYVYIYTHRDTTIHIRTCVFFLIAIIRFFFFGGVGTLCPTCFIPGPGARSHPELSTGAALCALLWEDSNGDITHKLGWNVATYSIYIYIYRYR